MTTLNNSNANGNGNNNTPRNQLHLELNPEFNLSGVQKIVQPATPNMLKQHALTAILVLIVAGVGAALLHAFGSSTGNTGSAISVIPAVLMG